MATNTPVPTEQDIDPDTATLERKRSHNVISRDDPSIPTSSPPTPRKRAKRVGKLGHQDVRDFVPAGASFSTSAVPVDEPQDSGNDSSQEEVNSKTETLSGYKLSEGPESASAEQHKALVEGRRLLINHIPPDATEEDLHRFFEGYAVEKIWFPDRDGNSLQPIIIPREECLSTKNDLPTINGEGVVATSIIGGSRLYVGNLSYAATVDDLREFFKGFFLEDVNIPLHQRTHRPVGYAFVTVSTADDADRAISALSGNVILKRKVSIQRARAEDITSLEPSIFAMESSIPATKAKCTDDNHSNQGVNVKEELGKENSEIPEISHSVSLQDVRAALPVNWNAVSNTKIRTTFGGTVGKATDSANEPRGMDGIRKEIKEHSKQNNAISVASQRVEGLKLRLSTMTPHDGPVSEYQSTQEELHDAQVDYYYCLYFPSHAQFEYPPSSTMRQSAQQNGTDSKDYRLRLWSMIEQCMKEGTLQDLKDGNIYVGSPSCLDGSSPGQTEHDDGPNDLHISTVVDPKEGQVLGTQETALKHRGYLEALNEMTPDTRQAKHPQEFLRTAGHNSENYHSNRPDEGSDHVAAADSTVVDPISNKKGTFTESPASDSDEGDSDRGVILNLDYGNNDQIFKTEEQDLRVGTKSGDTNDEVSSNVHRLQDNNSNIEASNRHQATKSGFSDGENHSDVDEVQNLLPSMIDEKDLQQVGKSGDDDQEMSNQSDDDLSASDSGTGSNSDTNSNESNVDSEGQSDDYDAMMQYSNSEQIIANEDEQDEKIAAHQHIPTASVLAELSTHDLNTQLRYFHTSKDREEVDGKTLVRCLVCAKEGHMAGSCESLTCSTCGAFNQHTTRSCPKNAKCRKCREQGHEEAHCPYKLKKMLRHEIVCELCQRNGHVEEDCELVWRTSGRPWESDFTHASVWLSCYECGHSGHLGNDCPSRRPGKPMGTSTWDGNMASVSIKSTRGLKIKGKATRQDAMNPDDSEDERAHFYKPRTSLPEPVRKGNIRIITGRRDSPVYEFSGSDRQAYGDHRHGSFPPVNDSYKNDDARQSYQEYRDGLRGDWRATDGPEFTTDYKDVRYNDYRPSDQRSRSPPYRGHNGYVAENTWPPPRPAPRAEYQERRPRADANLYRPMPSAAQNAWAKRRL